MYNRNTNSTGTAHQCPGVQGCSSRVHNDLNLVFALLGPVDVVRSKHLSHQLQQPGQTQNKTQALNQSPYEPALCEHRVDRIKVLHSRLEAPHLSVYLDSIYFMCTSRMLAMSLVIAFTPLQ